MGLGKNYLKWKIQYPDGTVDYKDPRNTQLIMTGCITKNSKKTAEKIFNGQHKTVCAWILCDNIEVKESGFVAYDKDPNSISLRYNPRENPYWVYDHMTPADGFKFDRLVSVGRKLFVTH